MMSRSVKRNLALRLTLLFMLPLAISGCAAKPPSKVETNIANWTKHHVTVGGKKDVNPIKASEESIDEGKQSFTAYCMVCHGLDGQNTGVPFATTISPPVPSLASAEVQSYTDGQFEVGDQERSLPFGYAALKRRFLRERDVADGSLHPAPAESRQPG